MKFIVLLIISVTSITHLHAHPADTDAANATSKAKDAVLGASKAPNDTDISKLIKDGHGPVNPVDILKPGTEFMSTVISACENFIKSFIKLFSPGSSAPGDLSKLTSIFNPSSVANLSKNMMDNILKEFTATDPIKKIPKNIPSKDAVSNAVSVTSDAISSPLKLFGL